MSRRNSHRASHDEADLPVLLEALGVARAQWTSRLRALTTTDFARSARHPRLDQPMRLIDHCVFVAEHDDHHLGRILQLLGDR